MNNLTINHHYLLKISSQVNLIGMKKNEAWFMTIKTRGLFLKYILYLLYLDQTKNFQIENFFV